MLYKLYIYIYNLCIYILRVYHNVSYTGTAGSQLEPIPRPAGVVMVEVQQLMAKEAASMVAKLGSQAQLRLVSDGMDFFSGHFRGFNGIYKIG